MAITLQTISPLVSLDPNDSDRVIVDFQTGEQDAFRLSEIRRLILLHKFRHEEVVLGCIKLVINAGLDPRTATLAQMKTAIQSGTLTLL